MRSDFAGDPSFLDPAELPDEHSPIGAEFLAVSGPWLRDYALFEALSQAHGGAPFWHWPAPLRDRDPNALEEARRELRTATDQYRQLRREIDRLQPELATQFAVEDRLLWDAEAHFPGGQLQLLAHEVDAGLSAFGSLNKLEQYARARVTQKMAS